MSDDFDTHTQHTQPVLAEAVAIAAPLATWLIRHGIGHAQFATALKTVFYQAADQELKRTGQKTTASAISLTSGLHRKDVKAFADATPQTHSTQAAAQTGKASVANQVFTRWLTQAEINRTLPISGKDTSFEALVSAISKDMHHRAVLDELLRIGVVTVESSCVTLARDAFTPNAELQEARQLMAESVADHLNAGVHNLTPDMPKKFLEQSVFVDGLSADSAQQLNLLANDIWAHALKEIVAAATPLCEQDAATASPHRFRLGVFSFSEPEQQNQQETHHA